MATEQGDDFKESCVATRRGLKNWAAAVLALKQHSVFTVNTVDPVDRDREDAAMRIGKAIQAYEGGVSIYDK